MRRWRRRKCRASFSRLNGQVWTTDKDGFIPALLSAEITAKQGHNPGELYTDLITKFGQPYYELTEAKATHEQKEKLKALSGDQIKFKVLAWEKIISILSKATGNSASMGGVKVITENRWFAARPSGTEDIYKIYTESFLGQPHLNQIIEQAQDMINATLGI